LKNKVIFKKSFDLGYKTRVPIPTWGTCTPKGTFAHLKGYI